MGITSLFIFLLANQFLNVVHPTLVTVRNNCPYTVWPGIITTSGKANTTGLEVASRGVTFFNISELWSGKIWGRYDCTNNEGKFVCASGDCGSGQIPCNGAHPTPPVSLAELTIEDSVRDLRTHIYDLNLVNGFNLPLAFVPLSLSGELCKSSSCPVDINPLCPVELAVKDAGGKTIGCKNGCDAYNKPEYCCPRPFNTPETCKPSNYSQFFKSWCPETITYPYDINNITTFGCGDNTNYAVIFCP